MAIKEVTEIPKSIRVQIAEPFEYTEKIMADIRYAYINKIKLFEFVGYNNPNYLCTYSKRIAFRFINEILFKPAKQEVREQLKEELKTDSIFVSPCTSSAANRAIIIKGVTLEDNQKHVYAEIDYEWIANFKGDLLERMRKLNKERIKNRKT